MFPLALRRPRPQHVTKVTENSNAQERVSCHTTPQATHNGTPPLAQLLERKSPSHNLVLYRYHQPLRETRTENKDPSPAPLSTHTHIARCHTDTAANVSSQTHTVVPMRDAPLGRHDAHALRHRHSQHADSSMVPQVVSNVQAVAICIAAVDPMQSPHPSWSRSYTPPCWWLAHARCMQDSDTSACCSVRHPTGRHTPPRRLAA